jgi:hypothetical protein
MTNESMHYMIKQLRSQHMKKTIILSTIFALLLMACSKAQTNLPQTSDGLPVATQLVVGTLQLEGTDQAVTSEQAQELLPMWQVYQEISNSSTAAQEEVDGLIEQIQETMNAGQMQAITEMNLTRQDVFAAIQVQNITVSSGGGQSSNSGGVSFSPPDGGMPDGGPPDAGMGGGAPPDGGMGDMAGMDGAGPSTSTDQNQEAGTNPGLGSPASVPTVLIDALIQYLEQLASP